MADLTPFSVFFVLFLTYYVMFVDLHGTLGPKDCDIMQITQKR